MRRFLTLAFLGALLLPATSAYATWSVIALDRSTGTVAIASATCVPQQAFAGFPAKDLRDVQAIVVPGKGVAAAQAAVDNTRANQRLIYAEMQKGTAPDQILPMLKADPRIERRQFAILDMQGRMTGFSGANNQAVSLHRQGQVSGTQIYYSIQGNILASEAVVTDAVTAFSAAKGELSDRVMAAMEAADAKGGDKRCTCESQPKVDAPCSAKTAHVAYILQAASTDAPGESYNDGKYEMYLSVADTDITPQEDANPVKTLRMRYDRWKKRPLMIRFLTAGESHGPALVVILEGIPAGLVLDFDAIHHELKRRQGGYGRGRRMAIESDKAEILSGVRRGETIGGPIAMTIQNRDWTNWQHTMSREADPPADVGGAHRATVTRPRPGHADLAGIAKYDRGDIRDILERASARETAARVAAGAVARQLLAAAGIRLTSHVFAVGSNRLPDEDVVTFERAAALPHDAPLRCVDQELEARMTREIDAARQAGDTCGGAFEVIATGLPAGLGSYIQWDRKLDGRLAQALMSIPAIKAVGVGLGPEAAYRPGSRVHDELVPDASGARATGIGRPTNRAGGLEGGVTNGEDVRVSAWMKPISTLMKPLRSVDVTTMTEAAAAIERSDVCAVPAAAVVGEAMVALILADALVEKFGGDSMSELTRALSSAAEALRARFSVRDV